jgi:secondary thiamine-phosphate synthase enzyme
MEFAVKTPGRVALVDITEEVKNAVARGHVREGLCNLFTPHTTAALMVSENWDPDVTTDLLGQLQKMVPRDGGYRHAEGNAQAHILAVLHGASLNLPLRDGQLALGRWQGVMLAEFDGPRERKVLVTLIAGMPT